MNGQSQLFRFSVNHCAKWAENAVTPPHSPKAADEYRGGIFFFPCCVGVDRIAIRKGGGGDGGKDTFRNTGRRKKNIFPQQTRHFSTITEYT